MTKYEEMKSKFLAELGSTGRLSVDDIIAISECLDDSTKDYSVYRTEDIEQTQGSNADILNEYLATKEVEGCVDGTVSNYGYILRKFFQDNTKEISCIESVDIRRWLKKYKETNNVSDATLDKYREALTWFFNWCHAEGKIASSPAHNVHPIKHEEKERKALTRLQLELLRGACQTAYECAAIEFLYSTACRVSELCNVKLSDVNMYERTVRIYGKGRKERTSWINARCYIAIEQMMSERKDDCEYLFVTRRGACKQCDKTSIERLISKIQSRIPDKIPYHVTPHVIRHSAATHSLESGMKIEQIQVYLGHKRINTTMRYAHVCIDDVATAHRKHVV